jgi:hypothetical protein
MTTVSAGIVRIIEEQGPLSAAELAQRMCLPTPHIRAAVSELCFKDRVLTVDPAAPERFVLGTPPDDWPKPKR